MAQEVQVGQYYYEITEELHAQLLAFLVDEPSNVLYQSLVQAFDYQSKYVPNKWYAPIDMIDDPDEIEWMEANATGGGYAFWFRNSQQPGTWYQG